MAWQLGGVGGLGGPGLGGAMEIFSKPPPQRTRGSFWVAITFCFGGTIFRPEEPLSFQGSDAPVVDLS